MSPSLGRDVSGLEIEVMLGREREERQRPRLRDRTFYDLIFLPRHPLHKDDLEWITYYTTLALITGSCYVVVKYILWVKDGFVRAKLVEDARLEKVAQMRAAAVSQQPQQQQQPQQSSHVRSYSTMARRRNHIAPTWLPLRTIYRHAKAFFV